jgi:hypothetical protein
MMRADNEHRMSTGLADQCGREIPIIALQPADIVRALKVLTIPDSSPVTH